MSERVKFFSINDLSINYYIKIVNTYVSDELKKFNYLKIILKSSSQKDLILTPFLKIKAKKAYESILKNYFDNSNSFCYNLSTELKKSIL